MSRYYRETTTRFFTSRIKTSILHSLAIFVISIVIKIVVPALRGYPLSTFMAIIAVFIELYMIIQLWRELNNAGAEISKLKVELEKAKTGRDRVLAMSELRSKCRSLYQRKGTSAPPLYVPLIGAIKGVEVFEEVYNYLAQYELFRRLKDILQLSTAYYAGLAGATHRRREHCCGVALLTFMALKKAKEKGILRLKGDEYNFLVKLGVTAGLIHDIYQPPFGHALDSFAKFACYWPRYNPLDAIFRERKFDELRLAFELLDGEFRKILGELITYRGVDILYHLFTDSFDDFCEMLVENDYSLDYVLLYALIRGLDRRDEGISFHDLDRVDYAFRDEASLFGAPTAMTGEALKVAINEHLSFTRIKVRDLGEIPVPSWSEAFISVLKDKLKRDFEIYEGYSADMNSERVIATEECLVHATYRFWARYQLDNEASKDFMLLRDEDLRSIINEYGSDYEKILIDQAIASGGASYTVVTAITFDELVKTLGSEDVANNINSMILHNFATKVNYEVELTQRVLREEGIKDDLVKTVDWEHGAPLIFIHPWQAKSLEMIYDDEAERREKQVLRIYAPVEWEKYYDIIARLAREVIVPPLV